LLGSDGYGRDQFSRLLFGGQVSLLAGLLGAGLTLVIGAGIGSVAGYFGGWRDDILMRLSELFLALPWLYLLFALRAFLPLAVNPLQAFFLIIAVIAAVGGHVLHGWLRRGAQCQGAGLRPRRQRLWSNRRLLWRRHILPETSSVLWTQAAILVPQYVWPK